MSGLGFRDRGFTGERTVRKFPYCAHMFGTAQCMFELCYIHGILRCSKVFNFMLLILSAILW